MVRLIRSVVAVCMVALLCVSWSATALATTYSPYNGSISTQIITYFEDILVKVSPSSDYVVFRGDQYDYYLVYGDLELNGVVFSGSGAVDVVRINTNSGYNTTYNLSSFTDSSFRLNAGDYICYSNLGHFPGFETRGEVYNYASLVVLVSLCLALLLHSVWFWRGRIGYGANGR